VAVGDVLVDRPNVGGLFGPTRAILEGGDVLFANCEAAYGDPQHRQGLIVSDRSNLEGLTAVRWNVLSCANNHILDGGEDAFLAMLDYFGAKNIAVAGAGRNLGDAWRPVVLGTAEGSIAVVACASVFPHGYEATPIRPGLAPLRADSVYYNSNPTWLPGGLPLVRTVTHEDDREALMKAISIAREQADIVVASFHWGDHTRPALLTDFEIRTAHEVIDAGADVVLGHHHHFLRGIDFYRGRPILYGLGHFIFDLPEWDARIGEAGVRVERHRFGEYGLYQRRGYPLLPFHPHGRKTMIARLCFDGRAVALDLVMAEIDREGIPQPLDVTERPGRRVLSYLRQISTHETLDVRYRVEAADSWSPVARVVAEARKEDAD
jgi:poly-gamma-glutamate synthesis protein (capsule biosynthesis protein)